MSLKCQGVRCHKECFSVLNFEVLISASSNWSSCKISFCRSWSEETPNKRACHMPNKRVSKSSCCWGYQIAEISSYSRCSSCNWRCEASIGAETFTGKSVSGKKLWLRGFVACRMMNTYHPENLQQIFWEVNLRLTPSDPYRHTRKAQRPHWKHAWICNTVDGCESAGSWWSRPSAGYGFPERHREDHCCCSETASNTTIFCHCSRRGIILSC